jgi:hypothetical protein
VIELSHWYQHVYNVRKMLILPLDSTSEILISC